MPAAPLERLEPRLLLDAAWTVMVYLAGDNDLEGAGIQDINEMEAVGSSDEVNVLVQFDRVAGHNASNGNWTETRRGQIIQDTTSRIISSPLHSVGEVNMGDPAALTDFVQWGISTHPAKHYMVVLWDHGNGINGVCYDQTSSHDRLTIREVGQALADVGHSIDLVGFDACLMGLVEQAYEIADVSNIMVASEQLEPRGGWRYDRLLGDLVAGPTQSAASLASSIVSHYSRTGGQTLSAIDLAVLAEPAPDGAADALSDFAAIAMADATDADYQLLQSYWDDTPYFCGPNYRDLGAFLSAAAGDEALSARLRTAAQHATDAYDQAILANYARSPRDATGLWIYFQPAGVAPFEPYIQSEMQLLADTQWDTFLQWWQTGPDSSVFDSASAVADMPRLVHGGEIQGGVWKDDDLDGVWDTDEQGLEDWAVYLDINADGTLQKDVVSTFQSIDAPQLIDDYQTICSTITVQATAGFVTDLNVTLDIQHRWASDLEVYLAGPTGRRVRLFSDVGGEGNNFAGTTLNDEANISITGGLAPFGGTYRPMGNLSSFDGQDAAGTWTLEVSDRARQDSGRLEGWSLTMTLAEPHILTGADGLFAFTDVPNGPQLLRQVPLSGWVETGPAEGGYPICVSSGNTVSGAFFGNSIDRPKAFDEIIRMSEDAADVIVLHGRDEQTAAQDLTYCLVGWPAHGAVTISGNLARYVPEPDYYGSDSFRFVVMDDGNPSGTGRHVGQSDPATVSITIDPVNDAPIAADRIAIVEPNTVAMAETNSVVISLTGSDLETPADDLTFAISRRPAHGEVVLNGAQATYTPDAGYDGPDSFSFTVTDDSTGSGSRLAFESGAATVSIGVARQEFFDASGLVLTRPNASDAVLSVRGGGTGVLYSVAHLGIDAPCEVTRIVLRDTGPQSGLTIRSRDALTVGGIVVANGSLGRVDAGTTNVIGDIDVSGGSLRRLCLKDISNGLMTIGASANPGDMVDILLGRVADFSINSGTPIRSLTAVEAVDVDGTADEIAAACLGRLRTLGWRANARRGAAASAGNFEANLTLGGAGTPAGKSVLGSASIKGNLRGADWQVAGPVGNVTVRNSMEASRICAAGRIGSVMAGAMIDTDILASPSCDIGKVTVRGQQQKGTPLRSFCNSYIAADTLGTVRLCDAEYDNGGVAFGITARHAGKISYVDRTDRNRNWSSPKGRGTATAVLDGDLALRLGVALADVDIFTAVGCTSRLAFSSLSALNG